MPHPVNNCCQLPAACCSVYARSNCLSGTWVESHWISHLWLDSLSVLTFVKCNGVCPMWGVLILFTGFITLWHQSYSTGAMKWWGEWPNTNRRRWETQQDHFHHITHPPKVHQHQWHSKKNKGAHLIQDNQRRTLLTCTLWWNRL